MEWFEKKNIYIYVDIINEIFLVYLKNMCICMCICMNSIGI